MKFTRLHQNAARTRHADGVARDEAYKSLRAVIAAIVLGKLPLSRLFCSHLHTHRAAYHLPSGAAWQHGPRIVCTVPTVLHCTARIPAHPALQKLAKEGQSATAATGPCSSSARTGHRRTHRKVSLFSDDICDGMLPVRRLEATSLHTSGSRRPMPEREHQPKSKYKYTTQAIKLH